MMDCVVLGAYLFAHENWLFESPDERVRMVEQFELAILLL
jgi:hypothetical protein